MRIPAHDCYYAQGLVGKVLSMLGFLYVIYLVISFTEVKKQLFKLNLRAFGSSRTLLESFVYTCLRGRVVLKVENTH